MFIFSSNRIYILLTETAVARSVLGEKQLRDGEKVSLDLFISLLQETVDSLKILHQEPGHHLWSFEVEKIHRRHLNLETLKLSLHFRIS